MKYMDFANLENFMMRNRNIMRSVIYMVKYQKKADDFCIRQLLPNKLKDQYCFKTESAIECLKFVKGEKIWLK